MNKVKIIMFTKFIVGRADIITKAFIAQQNIFNVRIVQNINYV